MAAFAHSDILLRERTDSHSAPSAGPLQVVVPEINGIRPRVFAIAEADGNFSVATGLSGGLGVQREVVAADLDPQNQLVYDLTQETQVWLQGTGGNRSVTIRWMWAHQTESGVDLGTYDSAILVPLTAQFSAPGVEAEITVPDGATQLVVQEISANSFTYRIDNGAADGTIITVDDADVSIQNPYVIHINDADRLRMAQAGGAAVLAGYWRIV